MHKQNEKQSPLMSEANKRLFLLVSSNQDRRRQSCHPDITRLNPLIYNGFFLWLKK